MQSLICFVIVFTTSLAINVTVNDFYNFDHGQAKSFTVQVSPSPWKFTYDPDNVLQMHMFIVNKPASVSALNVTYHKGSRTVKAHKYLVRKGVRKGQTYYSVNTSLATTTFKIKLNFNTSTILCLSLLVAEGWPRSNITKESAGYEPKYYHISGKHTYVVVVDLQGKCKDSPFGNETNTNTSHHLTSRQYDNIETTAKRNSAELQTTQNIVLIYVIPSMIVMCVTILVIYISIKKPFHRTSKREETMELNTYSTTNEVVYADLSFVHGDSVPPRHDEESAYAQIIGVLQSNDGNIKKS